MELSWREKLKGQAYNTWLHPWECEAILSNTDALSEPAAKVLYFDTQGKIQERLRFWEQSL